MDVREYDLNLIPGNVPQVIKINQYDKGKPLTFIIYQGDKKFSIPSGAIVALSGTKPDGLGFHYACTFSGSTASVTIGDQVAVLSGNVRAELTITSGDSVRLGTANFTFCVEPAALKDDTAVSDSDFPEIIKAANNIGAAQKSADAAAKSAQDAKSSASSAASAASNAISGEVTRAKAAEKANADAISAEVTRAKAAEKTNADAIKTKMEKDPVSFFQVASTAINRVGFSYISQMTDAPSGVNTFGHILIDAQTGRIGGDKDNKVIFFIPYDTDKIFYRLVHDGHVNDWVEMAPYSAVTTLSNQLTALGTDSYSLVDFVNDKKSLNTNDDYLHAYLVAGVTYVFSGDADEGLSGTSAAKRVEFQRMMEDCREGKIDRIITKSISRFARNTLDCIEYVRELKELGVTILFEKEHIDTAGAYSEMILTVLAAFAQEESRSLSENIKWGVRKRFQDGTDRWVSIYGYTKEGDETYVIVEDEAAVIRQIFDDYEHGLSTLKIGEKLDAAKVPTPLGKAHWDAALVHSILENEKYCGDIILQKFMTEDHLSHISVKNDGSEVPRYYIKDHHPAIVSREQFKRVEKIRHMNNKKNPEIGGNYPYGDLLKCPFCGRQLHQSKLGIYGNQRGWTCEGEDFLLRSDLLDPAVLECYEKLPVEELTDTDDPDVQTMLFYKKKHRTFSQVDFYWVDDLIDSIELGTHSGKDDHTVTVHWKCGLTTTAETDPSKMAESPQVLCKRSVEKKRELKARKLELRREKLRKKESPEQVQEENTDLKAQLAELMKRQQEQDELIKKLLQKAGA